ncbi:hypothetical protein B7463_g112, partial [Scytalidium lignicola]
MASYRQNKMAPTSSDRTRNLEEDPLIQMLLPIVAMPSAKLRVWLKRFYVTPLSASDARKILDAVHRLRPDEFQSRPSSRVLGKSTYDAILARSPTEINTYIENLQNDQKISTELANNVKNAIYSREPSLRPRVWVEAWNKFRLRRMEPETLIFMPNGDVTLTLIRNVMKDVAISSNTPSVASQLSVLGKSSPAPEQTPIDEDERREAAPEAGAEDPAEPEENVVYFVPDPPGGVDGPFYPPPPRGARGSDASSRRDRSPSPPASFWASLRKRAETVTEPSEDEEQVPALLEPVKQPERIIVSSHKVHCVVSSRHMMLASQQFQTILSGNTNEAITLRTKGHVSIPLAADLDAMIILLNIIHGASRKVPRQVSLEVLGKLAVLVRSFGMLGTVQFFSDTWIENQREGLPRSYNEDVLPLTFIFWVFDRPSEFKNMTRLAQRECDEKLDEDVGDIPIPHKIIDAIKRGREFAMETAITVINTLIAKYMDGGIVCDASLDDGLRYACDAMVLGSLMKSSRKIGIWPKPEAPFSGRKFKELARAIRRIRVLDVCNKSSNRRWNSLGPSSNCHGLEDSIGASLKNIEAGLDGLELSDYKEKSEDNNSGFQMFLRTPSEDKSKGETKQGTERSFPLYTKLDAVEVPKEDIKVSQREFSAPEFIYLTNGNSREREEPAQKEVKSTTRQYLRDFQQPELPLTPRLIANGANAVLRKEVKSTQNEKLKVITDKKLKRTTSYPKIPIEDVKSPVNELQVTPIVASIEEMVEEEPRPQKNEVKISMVEGREGPIDALTTAEEEDIEGPLPNLKIRKTKMRFSTRF